MERPTTVEVVAELADSYREATRSGGAETIHHVFSLGSSSSEAHASFCWLITACLEPVAHRPY